MEYANELAAKPSGSGGDCPANPLEGHIRYEKVTSVVIGTQVLHRFVGRRSGGCVRELTSAPYLPSRV